MRSEEFITELKSSAEVQELEAQLDKMFSTLGVDVAFSNHFVERLLGREKSITIDEIRAAFEKLKKKYKGKLLKAKKQGQVRSALQDFDTDLNVVFTIEPDKQGDGYDLVNLTVMRLPPEEFRNTGVETPYPVGSKNR